MNRLAGGILGVGHGILGRPLWLAAVAASAGAGVIHLAHGPAHLAELGALGAGFYLAAALQLGWAVLAFAVLVAFRPGSNARGTAALATSGIAINGAILAAWVTSRVVGLPAGAAPWTPEQIGIADGISAVLQGLLVVSLIATLRGWTLTRLPRVQTLGTAGAAMAIMLIATGTAVAISPSEVGHAHPPDYVHGESDEAGPSEHAAPGEGAETNARSEGGTHSEPGQDAEADELPGSDPHAENGEHGQDGSHAATDEHAESDGHAEDGGH